MFARRPFSFQEDEEVVWSAGTRRRSALDDEIGPPTSTCTHKLGLLIQTLLV